MVKLIIWAFIAYGMTTIIVYGSIFNTLREWIKKHIKFLGELVSCPLCTSTWVGFFLSVVLGSLIGDYFDLPLVLSIFFDGMFTAGIVWSINSIIEFFEDFNSGDSGNQILND